MLRREQIIKILDILEETYPDAGCELDYGSIYQLLSAVMLSAQTTDKSVNKVTPTLFLHYPNAQSLYEAGKRDYDATLTEITEYIHSIGMYRTKAKNLIAMSKELVEKHNGEVPQNYDALVALPGVGRKTANVVLAVGFGEQRIAVDTHVFRVANRIGITCEKDVLKTELSLMQKIPNERWSSAHHSLLFHGRYTCKAQRPDCESCKIREFCDFYKTTLKLEG